MQCKDGDGAGLEQEGREMTREQICEFIDEWCPDEGIMLADGFEGAFIGIGEQFNRKMAVYDLDKCVEILMVRDGMGYEEAAEYMGFNVTCAWVGEGTPCFLSLMENIIDKAGTA